MQFIETVCCREGIFQNLPLHQKRINKTFEKFFRVAVPFTLSNILTTIQDRELFKVTIQYDDREHFTIVKKYQKKTINTIKLVQSDEIDYAFKYADRDHLESLLSLSQADEIIIVKNGMITDSSFSNLVFWNGKKWITPKNPLLKGVKRRQLLEQNKIEEGLIPHEKMDAYEKISFINAMLDIGDTVVNLSHGGGLPKTPLL